jgi:class III poly(R)-hydroxyalkanoic acid synthase PhaE subunit
VNHEQKGPEGPEALFSAWMKTATDFWESMMKDRPEPPPSYEAPPPSGEGDEASIRMKEARDSIQKTWQVFSSVTKSPDFLESVSKGVNTLPEIVLKMSRVAFEGFSDLQKQWLDRMGRIGRSTEAYKFEDLDQGPFKAWMEMYEKEFKPFYDFPQLGLTRFYQERMAQAMDQFNRYQASMGEFFNLLYLPMEKSNHVLLEKIAALSEEGNLPENFQDYYRLWLKILEGHYMTLFKSPEFTQTLAETIKATENFMEAKQAVLQDLLQFLPVPTNKDMDDLYRELYLLKKKVKELDKKLQESQLEPKAI